MKDEKKSPLESYNDKTDKIILICKISNWQRNLSNKKNLTISCVNRESFCWNEERARSIDLCSDSITVFSKDKVTLCEKSVFDISVDLTLHHIFLYTFFF